VRRPTPVRQRGFGLLAFVLLTAAVALSLVVGFAGTMVRSHHNMLVERNNGWLKEQAQRIQDLWRLEAFRLDEASASNPYTAASVLSAAGVTPRWDAEARLSRVLLKDGLSYRVLVLYMPSESDAANPPNWARFDATGEFQPCGNMGANCAERQFVVISSLELQQEMAREARARLTQAAYRAQTFFKARLMLDPERNVSVNYFRVSSGSCSGSSALEVGCLDTYQSLVDAERSAVALGLQGDDLVSPWGRPIEASNLLDSESEMPPFTMSFRTRTPAGTYLYVKATQPL